MHYKRLVLITFYALQSVCYYIPNGAPSSSTNHQTASHTYILSASTIWLRDLSHDVI